MERSEIFVCDCCGGVGTENHTCPYKEDVNSDFESKCNCCGDCSYECAMDV